MDDESFIIMLMSLLQLHNSLDPTTSLLSTSASSFSSPSPSSYLLTSSPLAPLLFFTLASLLSLLASSSKKTLNPQNALAASTSTSSSSPSPSSPSSPLAPLLFFTLASLLAFSSKKTLNPQNALAAPPEDDRSSPFSVAAFRALSTEHIWSLEAPVRDADWRSLYGLSYPVLKPYSDYAVAMVLSRLAHGYFVASLAARYSLESYLISKVTNMVTRLLATKLYPEFIKIPTKWSQEAQPVKWGTLFSAETQKMNWTLANSMPYPSSPVEVTIFFMRVEEEAQLARFPQLVTAIRQHGYQVRMYKRSLRVAATDSFRILQLQPLINENRNALTQLREQLRSNLDFAMVGGGILDELHPIHRRIRNLRERIEDPDALILRHDASTEMRFQELEEQLGLLSRRMEQHLHNHRWVMVHNRSSLQELSFIYRRMLEQRIEEQRIWDQQQLQRDRRRLHWSRYRSHIPEENERPPDLPEIVVLVVSDDPNFIHEVMNGFSCMVTLRVCRDCLERRL